MQATTRRLRRTSIASVALALCAPALQAQQPASSRATISIAEAIARVGREDTVTIAGRATSSSGELQRKAFEVAVQDASAGIRLFSRRGDLSVAEGDSIVVTGVPRLYRGAPELIVSDLRVIPAPRQLTRPEEIALSAREAGARAGKLVRVIGTVEASGRSEGGQWLRLRERAGTDSGSITLWVGGNAGVPIDLLQYRRGDVLDVVGLVTPYRDNLDDPVVWQIVPRTSADVSVRGIPRSWYTRGGGLLALIALIAAAAVTSARLSARRHERALGETEDRYRQLLHLSPDAVIVFADDRILFTNPAAARLLEVENERALVGRTIHEFLHPSSRHLATPRRDTPTNRLEVENGASKPIPRVRGQLVGAKGASVDVEATVSPCRYHDRPAVVMLARDIAAQLRHEQDLHALALVDELTGLYNRRGFGLFAEQELERVRRFDHGATFVFADLDGLKRINDEFGHASGDEALRIVARALRTVVRDSDIIARWAGDEFVALVLDADEEFVKNIGPRLTEAVRRASAHLPYRVAATVGTSAIGPNDDTISAALARADAELYQRKSGRGQPVS